MTAAVTYIGDDAAPESIADFLANAFVRGMTLAEMQALTGVVRVRTYGAGVPIIREGVAHDTLFFLRSGTVEVRKQDLERKASFTIGRLEASTMFGEMSFLDHQPASATVVAVTECAVVYLTRDQLDQFDDGAGRQLREKLTTGVALAMVKRVRLSNDAHVGALQAELAESRLRNEFARFFIITMALFGLASLVQKVFTADATPTEQMVQSWGVMALTLAPIAWFARNQAQSHASFGVTLVGWRRSLAEAGAFSVALGIAALLIRLAIRAPGAPLITWGTLAGYSPAQFAVFFIAYGPHCFLQEFIGRGVIQGSLSRFMAEAGSATPIVLTSILFGIFHTYVSLSFALLTFVVSLVFGKIYQRHGTLLGVTLTHLTIGIASIAFGFN